MYSITIGVCILGIFSGISFADSIYPSDLPKCHKGDNECITEVVQLFANNYSDGIPSINLPSLDPLFVGRIDVIRAKKIGLLTHLTLDHLNWRNGNVKLSGLKNATFTITGFGKSFNVGYVDITMLIPNATLTADYELNINFLQQQINGQGKLWFEFEHFVIRWSFIPKIYEKDGGKQYIRINQPKLDYTFTNSYLNFGILNDNNAGLSLLENTFLNKNGKLLMDTIKPECAAEYATAFTDIVQPVFDKFSIDQLFFDLLLLFDE